MFKFEIMRIIITNFVSWRFISDKGGGGLLGNNAAYFTLTWPLFLLEGTAGAWVYSLITEHCSR